MSKKKKKLEIPSTRMGRFRAWLYNLDWTVILLEAVIIAASVISSGESYDLSKADSTGFLVWFLLFIGYLPLELFGIFGWFFGMDPEALLLGREILVLGICDGCMIALIWAVVKFWARPRFGSEVLRNTMVFLRILLFWGLFQFLCFGAVSIWEAGKLNPLHRHLHIHTPAKAVKR